MDGIVIVRTGGEIGIKSRPVRSIYEKILLRTVHKKLGDSGIDHPQLSHIPGRIYIHTQETEKAAAIAAKTFGISSTSPGIRTKSELGEIIGAGTELAKAIFGPGTFAVKCRRVGTHPYTSQQVSSALGEALVGLRLGLEVDLDDPRQILSVEIRGDAAILYSNTLRGPDGFPVGTQDTFLGIIDDTSESFLASWCMMKRGCNPRAMVLVGEGGPMERVLQNLQMLAEWMPDGILKATAVPVANLDPPVTHILQLRLAVLLARQRNIEGVVSGIHPRNLETIREIMGKWPSFFLPLAAMDKDLLAKWSSIAGIKPADFSRYYDEIPLGQVPSNEELDSLLSGARELKIRPIRK